jgi:photosystem II stability/assembly factor-like uncharacterized protein
MAKAGLLFVGTDDGIVLFSDPGGVGRWLRIGQELRGYAVRAIWPAADTPLVILAAADGMGLLRSEDGGQSWRQILDVQVRAIDGGERQEPHRMYVSTSDGTIYRSEDAGASWTQCAQGDWQTVTDAQLIAAHADALTLYLGLSDGTMWLSPDGGARWARYGTTLPGRVMSLAESPVAPGYLYAVADGLLYHCTSEEAQWQRIEASPLGSGPLAVLAGKQPVLLVAREDGRIGRSDDAGATWTTVAPDGAWEGGATAIVPVRYHIDTAFVGSGSGQLAHSTDRGRTWQILKQGLAPLRSIAAARLV